MKTNSSQLKPVLVGETLGGKKKKKKSLVLFGKGKDWREFAPRKRECLAWIAVVTQNFLHEQEGGVMRSKMDANGMAGCKILCE